VVRSGDICKSVKGGEGSGKKKRNKERLGNLVDGIRKARLRSNLNEKNTRFSKRHFSCRRKVRGRANGDKLGANPVVNLMGREGDRALLRM